MFSLLLSLLLSHSPISAKTIAEPDSLNAAYESSTLEAENLREQYHKMMEQKNCVGTKAADFRFLTRDGKETSLHNLSSEKDLLLIFYDPDCDDCHEAIDSIQKMNTEEKVNIVAIDSEEDRERWEETANSLPENWTVGFAIDPIQDNETYYIMTMPTIYLLNKDKTVILKDTTLEEIFNR